MAAIQRAYFLEQTDAQIFDVLGVDDRVAPATADQFMRVTFPLDQWQAAQVVAVQPQQFRATGWCFAILFAAGVVLDAVLVTMDILRLRP